MSAATWSAFLSWWMPGIQPQQIDLDFIEWLGDSQLPFVIVLTKVDKINQTGKSKNLGLLKESSRKPGMNCP